MTPRDSALRPIRRTPLYEEVAERLREFIHVEALQPGDRLLSERELAAHLGVSRTSVRQALTALRAVGLVEMRHGDGIYLARSAEDLIPSLTQELLAAHEHLPSIMEIREALETQAARLAARRRTARGVRDLRRHIDVMATALTSDVSPTSEEDAATADVRFHATITREARNELLAKLMGQLADAIEETRRASLAHFGRSLEVLDGHRLIADAIEARDEDLAAQRMREHLTVVSDIALVELERRSAGDQSARPRRATRSRS